MIAEDRFFVKCFDTQFISCIKNNIQPYSKQKVLAHF